MARDLRTSLTNDSKLSMAPACAIHESIKSDRKQRVR